MHPLQPKTPCPESCFFFSSFLGPHQSPMARPSSACLPISTPSMPNTRPIPNSMATAMSLLGSRGKSLDIGREGFWAGGIRPSTSESKPWLCTGATEPAAKLGAWPLAPSAGLPEDLTRTTKARNPVLPEFVTYRVSCLTWGKQLPQPCPWRSRSCICLRRPPPQGPRIPRRGYRRLSEGCPNSPHCGCH